MAEVKLVLTWVWTQLATFVDDRTLHFVSIMFACSIIDEHGLSNLVSVIVPIYHSASSVGAERMPWQTRAFWPTFQTYLQEHLSLPFLHTRARAEAYKKNSFGSLRTGRRQLAVSEALPLSFPSHKLHLEEAMWVWVYADSAMATN